MGSNFAKNEQVRKVLLMKSGYLKPSQEGHPVGIYLGLDILYSNIFWHLDIWFVSEKEAQAVDLGFDMNSLKDEERNAILLLKYELYNAKRYGNKNEFSSADIYKAVVLGKVRSVEELEAYKNKK